MAKILIIDDEAAILEMMVQLCNKIGHQPLPFQTGKEGMEAMAKERPELLIVDLRIGDISGLQIIQKCSEEYPDTAVIMVTGYGSVETAVEAMKLGAFDYLTKPFDLGDLQRTINRAIAQTGGDTGAGAAIASTAPTLVTESAHIIGKSDPIQEIHKIIEKVADNHSPVLLEGEFGSGKQLIARVLHEESSRREAPFKILHCSALPENLLEQELFGAGGHANTIFNRAQGGTVLLEEIHHLPIRLQSQLDSFLEDLNGRRLRGSLPENLDFRVIASTTESLEALAKDGKFREDLYYRISVIPVAVPPLRKRQDDIALLADHFLTNFAKLTGTQKQEIDKYAAKLLRTYDWPGNVGELQNAIERACTFAENGRVRPPDLPPKVSQKVEVSDEDANGGKVQLPIGSPLSEFVKKQERLFIRETLRYNGGSREKTASMLGISIATLYRKMGLKLEREKLMS